MKLRTLLRRRPPALIGALGCLMVLWGSRLPFLKNAWSTVSIYRACRSQADVYSLCKLLLAGLVVSFVLFLWGRQVVGICVGLIILFLMLGFLYIAFSQFPLSEVLPIFSWGVAVIPLGALMMVVAPFLEDADRWLAKRLTCFLNPEEFEE